MTTENVNQPELSAIQKWEAKKAEEYRKLLDDISNTFNEAFESTFGAYKDLPLDAQKNVFTTARNVEILTGLGLSVQGVSKPRQPNKVRLEVTDENILAFIGTGNKTKTELESAFKTTGLAALIEALDRLSAGKKAVLTKETKTGPKKNGTRYAKK